MLTLFNYSCSSFTMANYHLYSIHSSFETNLYMDIKQDKIFFCTLQNQNHKSPQTLLEWLDINCIIISLIKWRWIALTLLIKKIWKHILLKMMLWVYFKPTVLTVLYICILCLFIFVFFPNPRMFTLKASKKWYCFSTIVILFFLFSLFQIICIRQFS